MNGIKILVVDDEERMRTLIRDFLAREGYTILEAADGAEALRFFYEDPEIDLILCDVMLPKIDGWEVLQEIRKQSKVPVILLTAKGEERDQLFGFGLGADDYIPKPFSLHLLSARVAALLKRSSVLQQEVLTYGILEADLAARSVKVNGNPIELSMKEFDLLRFFLENPSIALSRDSILTRVWKYDYDGDARTIDTHVKKLRHKLGDAGRYIHTIWGIGYKFEVNA